MTGALDRVARDPALPDRAAAALREAIVEGLLPARARINIDEAAQMLDMSPIPIREALRALASEGLVVASPHRGYRVRAATVEDLHDTYRLREVLDPTAVRLAVPRLQDDDLEAVAEEVEGLGESYRRDDWPAFQLHHRRVHFGIYERCGATWLLRFVNLLWNNSDRYRLVGSPYRGTPAGRYQEHVEILDACRDHDAALASRLMRDHLQRTHQVAAAALARGARIVAGGVAPGGAEAGEEGGQDGGRRTPVADLEGVHTKEMTRK
ncbi:MAG: GntR family transcriptional regulator [Candidatus Dormibacterales bacterium]